MSRYNNYFLWIAVCLLIGNMDHVTSRYRSRQVQDQVPHGHKTKFWIYTPEDYSDNGEAHPLLISLHGGSAIGSNPTMLFERTHENPAQLIRIDKWYDLPLVVVSPQLRRDPKVPHYNEQNWPPDLVDEVVQYVLDEYNVDPKRIYVTGISLGAAGAWNYAAAYPDRVAALLPMGGQAPIDKACTLRDVPIWAFHGENDVFVPTRFTREMIDSIRRCPSDSRYVPHVTICKSMEHEVWDQIFNMKGCYDVYSWMLSFQKGDTTNKAPFVFAGIDRRFRVTGEPAYLTAELFDSDGTIEAIRWEQVNNGSKALDLENANSRFVRINGIDTPGKYTFRITVTDNSGAMSTDEVTFTYEEKNVTPAILSLSLTNQSGSVVHGPLENDQVYDLDKLGSNLNILAATDGHNVTMRWSVNSDESARLVGQYHLRFWKDYGPFYLQGVDEGPVKSGWNVSPGEYIICATAFENGVGAGRGEGTSLCYKINFIRGSGDAPTDSPSVSPIP